MAKDNDTKHRFIELDSVMQKYGVFRTERVRAYGEMLEKCRKELSTGDLSDVIRNRLLDMVLIVEDRLRDEMRDIRHFSKEAKALSDFSLSEANTYKVD